jgi:TolA-binding protein
MKRTILLLAAICGIVSLTFRSTFAQNTQSSTQTTPTPSVTIHNAAIVKPAEKNAETTTSEVDILKHRIEEVENQNRLLLDAVKELKARLDAVSPATNKQDLAPSVATASKATQPATAKSSVQSEQAEKNQSVRWPEIISEGNKVKLYGFLRLDLDFDTQHPNNTQTPLFITSPDPQGRWHGERRLLHAPAPHPLWHRFLRSED